MTRWFTVGLLLSLSWPAIAIEPAEELLEQVREATLDRGAAIDLGPLEIDLGLAALVVESGILIPAAPIDGQIVEVVFAGRARFRIEPPNDIEAAQLELFTNQEMLDEPIERAVLVIGNTKTVRAILEADSGEEPDPGSVESARGWFEEWRNGVERTGFGADAAIVKSLSGDAAFRDYFALWSESAELGPFYYQVHPEQREQVVLGQFVPLDLDLVEKHQADKAIRRERRRGRLLQLTSEELGDWDTWIQSSLTGPSGDRVPGDPGFEPTHYQIELTIGDPEMRASGLARVTVRTSRPNRRSLSMTLYPDLLVDSVRDESGTELGFFRSDRDLHVILTDSAEVGTERTLEIAYGGQMLDQIEKGIFALSDTGGWYPRTGAIDRATYDVTLRWPRRVQVIAGGTFVDRGREGDLEWERRRIDLPAVGFSFEIGDFDVFTDRVGHTDLRVAFSKTSFYIYGKDVKQEVVATIKSALSYFESTFGAYPLDELTVVTVPRDFSQGYLSFVTVAQSVVSKVKGRAGFSYLDWFRPPGEHRTETIAHELAHQWWGNTVGWVGYRDQWLSEALATYSSVLFTAGQVQSTAQYLARRGFRWPAMLQGRAENGRFEESLGPVVLGGRLFSSKSQTAYQAIVYEKGALVLGMLAAMLQEDPFNRMLAALAEKANNRPIDTETFLRSLERMSGVDLQPFADRFVYGTGIPEIYYSYRFVEGADGRWTISGQVRQIGTGRFSYDLTRPDGTGWDVTRRRLEIDDIGQFPIVVPFQIDLASTASPNGGSGNQGLAGSMVIRGEVTGFEFPIDSKPSGFWLDYSRQVLGRFISENDYPKQAMRLRAMELDDDEALPLLESALDAPYASDAQLERLHDDASRIADSTNAQDGRIQLEIARIHLDRGDDLAAESALDQARKKLRGQSWPYDQVMTALECRYAVRQGDFEDAYKALSKDLRLRFPVVEGEAVGDVLRRKKFASGRWGSGADYALLAVASFQVGKRLVAERSLLEAEERGANMELLKRTMESHDSGRGS